jgi:hypothetical protein
MEPVQVVGLGMFSYAQTNLDLAPGISNELSYQTARHPLWVGFRMSKAARPQRLLTLRCRLA